MGSFMCIGYFSPIHGTDGLKSPKEACTSMKHIGFGINFLGLDLDFHFEFEN